MVATTEYFTNGSTTSFLYNSDGIRTRKTTGNIMTEYFLNGDVLVAEKRVNTTTQAIVAVIWYIYDDAGDILGLIYNGTPYYYLKNQQGDVISIVDADMNVVNSYTYDAWGKVMAITGSGSIGAINPIRYRGYYYDTESGLYYLQSRYYDPETGRFVNADDTDYLGASGTVLGYNLFAYCENNPVNCSDPTGMYTAESLQKKSFLFKLASYFGMNLTVINRTRRCSVFRLNMGLIKLNIGMTIGLTKNYNAGMSFNLSKDSVGISTNLGLGAGYSLAHSLTITWKSLSRSMSIVYCAVNDGVFVSLDIELEISHIATVGAIVACCYAPQLIPVVKTLTSKSRTAPVVAARILVPVMRSAAGAF